MADKKGASIIRKKKIIAGHGHHGGAWKVAYADFVTAMMAFFMVMWLMGSDDETKAQIAHYFNSPNTPYKSGKDPKSQTLNPMGDKVGEGESLLAGLDGLNPDEAVSDPARQAILEKNREISELITEETDGQAYAFEIEIEYLKFSLPGAIIFQPGTSQIRKSAQNYLEKIGRILRSYKGFVTIESYTDDANLNGHPVSSQYEASIIKSVAVMNYIVEKNWMLEERIHPIAGGHRKGNAHHTPAEVAQKANRIEFSLSMIKKY